MIIKCQKGKLGMCASSAEDLEMLYATPKKEEWSGSRLVWALLVVVAVAVLAAAGVGLRGAGRGGGGRVVSCYYTTGPAPRQLPPRAIQPRLCTHINVAFAQVRNKTIHLEDHQYATLREVVRLRDKNPELKVLLSVGGAGSGNGGGFSEMVVDHASRKIFIRSIKSILRNFRLDGIDLDWEFPAVHSIHDRFRRRPIAVGEVKKRERQHFSQLLREIRMEYIREKRDYLLTVAVAAQQTIVDTAYDVDQLDMYVDYVNLMTYDFHFYNALTPFTGLNSPLYARPEEKLYLASLNINYTVHMYMDKGLRPSKIVVGIPTYGHTFTLVNPNNNVIGSPASGYGALGGGGFANYPDICQFTKNNSDVVVKNVDSAKVPYLYRGAEWVSYDTPQSVAEKAKFIKQHRLRGAMIYSLNADDFEGVCEGEFGGNVRFPLSQSVKDVLKLEYYI